MLIQLIFRGSHGPLAPPPPWLRQWYAVYEEAESQAHEELFFYIRNELMTNPEVKTMTESTSRLEGALKTFGVTELKQSSKKHLRRKLESEFGASLHFFSDGNGRLVYPDRNELGMS